MGREPSRRRVGAPHGIGAAGDFFVDLDLKSSISDQNRGLRRAVTAVPGGWRRPSPDRPTDSVGILGRRTWVGGLDDGPQQLRSGWVRPPRIFSPPGHPPTPPNSQHGQPAHRPRTGPAHTPGGQAGRTGTEQTEGTRPSGARVAGPTKRAFASLPGQADPCERCRRLNGDRDHC